MPRSSALTPTPDRKGYWIVGADGGVFNYGDAGFYGSAGNKHLNAPIVGMASRPPTGRATGWSPPTVECSPTVTPPSPVRSAATHLNAPVVGIAGNGTGGYWLVASDGGVFAYGSASFHGSAGRHPAGVPDGRDHGAGRTARATTWPPPTVGCSPTTAPFLGSASGVANSPIIGISAGAAGGYALAGRAGAVYAYGSGDYFGNQSGVDLDRSWASSS